MPFWHAIGWVFGLYPTPAGTPASYQFWSGIAPGIAIVTVPFSLWRKHCCHFKGCWRIARHTVDGSPWCDRHHARARETYNRKVTNTEVS